jgi:hypothetical protein
VKFACCLVLCAVRSLAVQIPAGAELSIRLSDKVASDAAKPQAGIHAVLIAPVMVNGNIAIPSGTPLTGEVKAAKPASEKERAQLQLVFNRLGDSNLAAVVSGLDNAREAVDDQGVVTGINGSETFSARINQGIAKLQDNDRFSALAGLIQGARQVLNVQDANPNIDYDAGVELTLRLTQPLDWTGAAQGPESKLQPFPNESALADLVARQPFRTVAENPPRPSDMTNLMFIATEAELRAAFEAAGWSTAARLSGQSKLETARALIEARGYKEGPMSVLLLNGDPPAFAYQKGNNTFAQRHHLRIFRRPETFAGKPVWVCSSTHDIGINFSERDRTFIHVIDPDIDKERAKVTADLLFTGMVKALALVDRSDIPTNATNATGDPLHTDGRMAVLLLQ